MHGQGVMAMLACMCVLCPGAAVGVEDEGSSMVGVHATPLFHNFYLVTPHLAAQDQSLGEVHLERHYPCWCVVMAQRWLF